MTLTKHALIRSKQRGISKQAMEFAISHGKSNRRPGNVVAYTLNKKDAKFLRSDYMNEKKVIKDIEKATKIKAIVNPVNGEVITVYHRG